MRAPLPRETLQPGASTDLQAGRVVPFRDYGSEQTQALGQTMLKAGVETMNTADWLQDRYDEAEAKGADSRLAEKIQKVMRAPEGGYLNQIGKSAVGKPREDAFAQIDSEIESIAGSLGNDRQREMFKRIADARRMDAIADADAHESKQIKVYAAGESEARAQSFANDAFSHHADPSKFAADMARMRAEVDAAAELMGLPKDSAQRAGMHLAATTRVHSLVISSRADGGDAQGATEWLARYGDQIAPQEREKLARITRTATTNDKATKYADAYHEGARAEVKSNRKYGIEDQGERIAAENRPFTDAELANTESRAMRLVKEDFDAGRITADERDAIERKLAGKFQDDRSLAARAVVGVLDSAKKWAHANPGTSFDEAPPSLRDQVEQYNVSPEVDQIVRTYGVGKTDAIGAAAIMRAASDKEWLLGFKTWEEIHKQLSKHMTTDALKGFLATWQEARTPGALPKDVASDRVRNAVYDSLGILGKLRNKEKITDDEMARAERLQNTILSRIYTVSGGKEDRLTSELIDREIDAELSQKAKLWDSKQEVPLGSMSPTERVTSFFETPSGYTVYRKGSVAPGKDFNVVERNPRWIPMTQDDEQAATKFLESVNANLILQGRNPLPITAQRIADYIAESYEAVYGKAADAGPIRQTEEQQKWEERVRSGAVRWR